MIIISSIFIIIAVAFFAAYWKRLLNREVYVRSIIQSTKGEQGDLFFVDNIIYVKFFWSLKRFTLNEITEIKIYSIANWGLEEIDFIEIAVASKESIFLDRFKDEHLQVLETVIQQLSNHSLSTLSIDWNYLPFKGDKMQRDTFYRKLL